MILENQSGRPWGQEVSVIRIQKILYPTDFSSYSNQAYFHAIALAEKHGATLTVVFVYNREASGTAGSKGDPEAGRRYWREQLEQIRPLDPGITVQHVFLEGDPAGEIVQLCPRCGHGHDRHGHARPNGHGTAAAGQRGGEGASRRRLLGDGRETAPSSSGQ